MLEQVIVFSIVGGAAAWIGYSIWQMVTGVRKGCGCAAEHCERQRAEHR